MGRTQQLAFLFWRGLSEEPELLIAQGRTDPYGKKEMAPSVLPSWRKPVERELCRWRGLFLQSC